MKIAVMGAGAVGCYYGALLARAGHDVTLIGRPQHVQAIRQQGLLFDSPSYRGHVSVHAHTEPSAVSDADWVLVCVKSTDTDATATAIRPYLTPKARVFSLQNGVDNAARLQAALHRPVMATVVYVATEMAGPGHVRHHGRGELVIGPGADSAQLAQVFQAAGIPVQVSDNVIGALWSKLILNCAYNALSAIAQLPYGRLVQGPGVWQVMRDVMLECQAVANADGVEVPGDPWLAIEAIARTMPGQQSSTAQDLARGRRSEIDHLNGYVVRRGEALGIPTPINRVLHSAVKLLEMPRNAH